MRIVCLAFCAGLVFAVACDGGGGASTEAKARVQAGQVTFAGDLVLDGDLNKLVKDGESMRSRRTSLRKPLWGLYELLKGPEIVRAETATVAALPTVLSDDEGMPKPELAEMIRLAGIGAISLATSEMASADEGHIKATEKALKRVEVTPIGLLEAGGAGAGLGVHRVELGGSWVSLVGVALAEGAPNNRRVAAFGPDKVDDLVAAVKAAAAAADARGDACFAVVGWPAKAEIDARRTLAHRLIDEAGVDVVLGHGSGAFEGVERHGSGAIIYNPGPLLRCDLKKSGTEPGIVFRVHLDGKSVSWIEAQPVELSRRLTKIGMGTDATHGVVDELVKRSAALGTTVVDEEGRGILDLAASTPSN